MSHIRTFTGRYVYLKNPGPEDIDIRDIAHALSQINRFTGHTSRPYSVAAHSMAVAAALPPHLRLAGLLHDASEAYLGDVSSPLKRLLGPVYTHLEDRWMRAIHTRCGVSTTGTSVEHAIKQVDIAALLDEKRYLFPEESAPWLWPDREPPSLPEVFRHHSRPPRTDEWQFLAAYQIYGGNP